MRNLNRFITESINFQSTNFFDELVIHASEIKGFLNTNPKTNVPDDMVISLEKCIFDNTGLTFEIDVKSCGGGYFAVEIPRVNKNNPLISNELRTFLKNTNFNSLVKTEKTDVFKGTVDIKKAKVSGVFSKIPHKMILDKDGFTNNKLTPEEIAAITLHEIGHIFTYYEYITRTVTTNQILSSMNKELLNTYTEEKREFILMTVKKSLQLKDLDEKELAKCTNNQVIETVVIRDIVDNVKSELGHCIYDLNSWEALSDQFATRFQAGKHLVTGLEKIYKDNYNISFRSTGKYFAMEAIKVILFIAYIATLGGGLFPGVIFYTVCYTLVLIDNPSDIYDTPETRINRIRNQITEHLKQSNLSENDKSSLNDDLKVIDDILITVKDRRQLTLVVWEFISPGARKNRNFIELQKNLEILASNELFNLSSMFKKIA